MDTMEARQAAKRRRHDDVLKQAVLSECSAPGASVASVALARGLNANLVHKWRREARAARTGTAVRDQVADEPRFVAVSLPPPAQSHVSETVQLELRRGALTVSCTWPVSEMPRCAAWLREILR